MSNENLTSGTYNPEYECRVLRFTIGAEEPLSMYFNKESLERANAEGCTLEEFLQKELMENAHPEITAEEGKQTLERIKEMVQRPNVSYGVGGIENIAKSAKIIEFDKEGNISSTMISSGTMDTYELNLLDIKLSVEYKGAKGYGHFSEELPVYFRVGPDATPLQDRYVVPVDKNHLSETIGQILRDNVLDKEEQKISETEYIKFNAAKSRALSKTPLYKIANGGPDNVDLHERANSHMSVGLINGVWSNVLDLQISEDQKGGMQIYKN